MTLDCRLNWDEHINKLRAKAKKALNTMKVVIGKKWGRVQESLKKLYSAIRKTKMDIGCQLYNTASAGKFNKLDSIHKEGIRIYIGGFRILPVETLHLEANNPPLELRFLYKLKNNTLYIEPINLMDDKEPKLQRK